MKASIPAALVAALPLSYLLWLSGAVAPHAALGATLAFALVVLGAGRLCLRAAGAGDLPHAAAWVAGVFSSALAVYALLSAFPVGAFGAFAIWSVLVLAASLVWRPRAAAPAVAGGRLTAVELAGMALCGAATVLWCRDIAAAPSFLAQDRVLMAWVDYFIHGGVIAQFGDARAFLRGGIFLADYPPLPYHYASYMLPAALAGALDLPGLPAATSIWLPLGFLTLCLGAYALGSMLGGPAGGVAAVAVLTALPDASNYGLRNGFLSFHWHLLALPGSGQAAGVLFLSVLLLQRWTEAGSRRALCASLCLAAGAVLFRVHFFALAFPAVAVVAALSTRWVRAHLLAAVVSAIVAFALFVAGFYLATEAAPALEMFLNEIHNRQEPTAYTWFYWNLVDDYSPLLAVPAGMLLVFVACLGALIVLYPLSALVARRSGAWRAIDRFPPALLGSYVVLMITAPMVHWDATELTIRPFVLLYAVLAVWTAARLAGALAALRPRAAWPGMLALAALALLLIWPHAGRLGQPRFYWGWMFYPHTVHRGVPEAAAFLRRNSLPGDLLAVRGLTREGWDLTDVGIELASLSGTPAYLAYLKAHTGDPGERHRVALQRYRALQEVEAADSQAQAAARLRDLGVQWYVTAGEKGPRWDPQRRGAAFVSGEIAVYSAR
jgi:hypothetical protein